MSQDERKRRPDLSRTRPIRAWSTLFPQPKETGKPKPGDHANAPDAAEPAGRDTGAQPAQDERRSGFEETVAHSVELGYRVVDEYVRRGQEAAQRMRAGTYGTAAFVQDARDVAERMIRGISDVVGAWGELLELGATDEDAAVATGSSGTDNGGPGTVPGHAGDEMARLQGGPWRVRVRVEAKRAVDVAVDIDSSFDEREVSVHALRATDGSEARLADVGFELDSGGMPTVIVRVGAEDRSGSYRGLLVDGSSGRPVGTLSVSVHDC